MKKTVNLVIRILIVALVSGLIEVFVFNLEFFIKARSEMEVNKVLNLDDFTIFNWDNSSGKMVSMYDPILAIQDYNGHIDSIKIRLSIEGNLPYIDVFYSNEENPEMSADTQIKLTAPNEDGSYSIDLNKYVQELRIDLGDDEGLVLNDISVLINENIFRFSVARFVTMNLIYWFGVLLFAAQRPPKYNI